jgi:dihydropteroate synthase
MTASVVSSLWAAVEGAGVVRVHDVASMSDAIRVWGSVRGWA